MGNICCGGAEEKKVNAIVDASDVTDRQSATSTVGDHHPSSSLLYSQHSQGNASSHSLSGVNNNNNNNNNDPSTASAASLHSNALTTNITTISPAEQKAADERYKAVQDEQARLELIVQATGRGMVPVRSPRGSTGYYDQGFAAALAQHLEQTTTFPERGSVPLPPPCRNSSTGGVYACMAQPEWEGVALGNKDGENPVAYMDHIAEQFLDATIPKKERLYANVAPIMENLL